MSRPRLLVALDMDGTLLRDDKTVAPIDAEAIRQAAAHGIAVTLATGRLVTGTLSYARELGLAHPLICADGGLLIDPATATVLDRRSISIDDARKAVEAMLSHNLVPFVFLPDSIHCDSAGLQYRPLVDTWSRDIVIHPSLIEATAWRHPEGVALAVGIGSEDAVKMAHIRLVDDHAHALDSVYFSMRGVSEYAVRSLPAGCDKGDMLDRLAGRLGLGRQQVVAVGDWFNDLGMFSYAGRSFAMAQAPDVVKSAATDVLRASSSDGGGIAEALSAILAGDRR